MSLSEDVPKVWIHFGHYHDHVPVSVIEFIQARKRNELAEDIKFLKNYYQSIKNQVKDSDLMAKEIHYSAWFEFVRKIDLIRAIKRKRHESK